MATHGNPGGSGNGIQVQIPLWAMATLLTLSVGVKKFTFRFLYGQWQLGNILEIEPIRWVQIPLWAMATK